MMANNKEALSNNTGRRDIMDAGASIVGTIGGSRQLHLRWHTVRGALALSEVGSMSKHFRLKAASNQCPVLAQHLEHHQRIAGMQASTTDHDGAGYMSSPLPAPDSKKVAQRFGHFLTVNFNKAIVQPIPHKVLALTVCVPIIVMLMATTTGSSSSLQATNKYANAVLPRGQ